MKRSSALILALGLAAAVPAASIFMDSEGAAPWSGSLLSPARAAEDVSFDNLSATLGGATITVPHIAISGSSLPKSELQALFTGSWGLATADTLAKFGATSVVIPEIHVEIAGAMPDKNAPPMKASAVYHDLRLDGIKAGKASRVSASGMTEEVTSPAPISVSLGSFLATDYDLASVVRFVYGTSAPGEAPKVVAGPASINDIHVKGTQGVEVSVGKLATGAMKLRPLSTPVWNFVTDAMAASAASPGKSLPPAEAAKMITLVTDFYDAFSVDGMSISDISIKIPDPKFQSAALKTVKFGPIANSRFAELGVEGFELYAEGGHVKLGRVAILGVDLKPMMSALAAAAKKGDVGDSAMKDIDWHTAIPHLDGFVVKNIDLLIPEGSAAKALKLAGYELRLGNYVGGIPTSLRTQLDDLVVDASILKEGAAQLLKLGYTGLDLSSALDVVWNENSKTVNVNEVSAKGANMGSVSLKGVLGNVPRELFAGSMAEMQVAGLGVTLSEATLRLENSGLLDKIVAQMAKAQGTTPDTLRAQWGTQAALGIPQLLGGSDKAKALANAVASFIAKPKSLSISIKAKDATGLGLTDVMSGGTPNPADIFGKLDVTATANQ